MATTITIGDETDSVTCSDDTSTALLLRITHVIVRQRKARAIGFAVGMVVPLSYRQKTQILEEEEQGVS